MVWICSRFRRDQQFHPKTKRPRLGLSMGRIARTGSSPEKLFTIKIACRSRNGNGTDGLYLGAARARTARVYIAKTQKCPLSFWIAGTYLPLRQLERSQLASPWGPW
jgi:hypothetical protein